MKKKITIIMMMITVTLFCLFAFNSNVEKEFISVSTEREENNKNIAVNITCGVNGLEFENELDAIVVPEEFELQGVIGTPKKLVYCFYVPIEMEGEEVTIKFNETSDSEVEQVTFII